MFQTDSGNVLKLNFNESDSKNPGNEQNIMAKRTKYMKDSES